ncbi:MAG TPA: LppP/LprE family lipoprotein [Solirubrobacteraceae bacterium]
MNARMNAFKLTRRALLPLVGAGAIAICGCGSGGTKTASVSSAASPATATTHTTTQGTTPSSSTTTTNATPSGGAEASRTTTAPAFTKEATSTEGLSGAVAIVKARGFTPNDTADYHSGQTLRVLTATRTGSGDGYAQQAFFFVGNHYLGTDTSQPSASVKVVAQGDTEVTLAYPLYRPHDPLCCPGGGQATVRFQLNNGKLVPLGTIPPSSSTSGLSRG